MGIPVQRIKLGCSLVLAVALPLAGCSSAAVVGAPADAALFALKAPRTSDDAAILEYLKASQSDFTVIDTILADKDLGLLDDSTTGDEAFTAEAAAKYKTMLGEYNAQIKSAMADIKDRETPSQPDIAQLKKAETAELDMTGSVLEEYMQILKYYNAVLNMSNDLQQLDSVNKDDLQGTYEAYNKGISKAIDELKQDVVPSCLKSMNDSLIGALSEMNDAVLYSLNALALNDPIRTDAAQYRMEILLRKVTTISTGLTQDLTDRQKKLTNDMKSIQTENEGLKNWVQGNIDLLEKN